MISVCFFENKKIFSNWFIYVFLESYALNGNRVNELYMIVRDGKIGCSQKETYGISFGEKLLEWRIGCSQKETDGIFFGGKLNV